MRVLITGAKGFVGGYLARYLRERLPDAELYGTTRSGAPQDPAGVQYTTIDLRDPSATEALIAEVRPDAIYHLAGQAFVPRSFEDPWDTLETNVRAQLNVFLACIAQRIAPRILITGSAEVYGVVDRVPIDEDCPLRPVNPYSVSKVAQDMLALQYHASHQLPIVRVRAFNHFGPGQSERFVAPAFAMQIARIEAGLQAPVLQVGDLSDRRDFTDVRDIVRAYHLVLEHGTPGAVYNVASGQARSIRSLLDTLLSDTTARISVEVDPARLRPSRLPVLQGDITRLQAATGWQPQYSFEQTLRDILDDCRQRVAHTP